MERVWKSLLKMMTEVMVMYHLVLLPAGGVSPPPPEELLLVHPLPGPPPALLAPHPPVHQVRRVRYAPHLCPRVDLPDGGCQEVTVVPDSSRPGPRPHQHHLRGQVDAKGLYKVLGEHKVSNNKYLFAEVA